MTTILQRHYLTTEVTKGSDIYDPKLRGLRVLLRETQCYGSTADRERSLTSFEMTDLCRIVISSGCEKSFLQLFFIVCGRSKNHEPLRGESCSFFLGCGSAALDLCRHVSLSFLLILLAGVMTGSFAQEKYPNRPITIVAPFPPGGVADLTARPVAAALEKVLKNPVVVSNKTGAAGAVGMAFVANSKPDGYNLLMALSSISIIPEADKLFGRKPAYTMDQLVPIALISADPTIFVVSADRPWKSVKEFVDDAKKRPGQISYSSSGVLWNSAYGDGNALTCRWNQLEARPLRGRGAGAYGNSRRACRHACFRARGRDPAN